MFEIIALASILLLAFIFYILFKRNGLHISNKPLILSVKFVILVAGIVLIYVNLSDFNEYTSRKSWQKVAGEIVSFEIVGIKTKEPEISYKFQANNLIYISKTNLETPLFGSRKYQEQTARTISGNYKVGDSVIVYYNPANPEESHLKITPGWSTYIQFTFGIFIVSIMLALIIPVKSNNE